MMMMMRKDKPLKLSSITNGITASIHKYSEPDIAARDLLVVFDKFETINVMMIKIEILFVDNELIAILQVVHQQIEMFHIYSNFCRCFSVVGLDHHCCSFGESNN